MPIRHYCVVLVFKIHTGQNGYIYNNITVLTCKESNSIRGQILIIGKGQVKSVLYLRIKFVVIFRCDSRQWCKHETI